MDTNALTQAIHDAHLKNWQASPEHLKKTYKFKDFASAIAYMAACQSDIDTLNHHPEWTNIYNTIEVTLRSHDAGDIVTDKDIALAALLDRRATDMALP